MTSIDKQQFGDFQTPSHFAEVVVKVLKNKYYINPNVIIEPTMGEGSFILESIKTFPLVNKVFGIDINSDYIKKFKTEYVEYLKLVHLFNEDIFSFDFDQILNNVSKSDQILLIGNPPWVTNSTLSTVNSINLPLKKNFKKNKGIDAITGKSNFDIAEYILLDLMSAFKSHYGTWFAFLCKNTVAKNIVRDIEKYNFSLDIIDIYEFSAKDVFNVSTDAVLFVARIGKSNQTLANVLSIDDPNLILSRFGWSKNTFISNMDSYLEYADIDGKCSMTWRQGIKHDASKTMEFRFIDGKLINGYGENVDFFDSEYLYPLVKSSMIKNPIKTTDFRYVLVTQKKVGDNTNSIEIKDIRVWNYLNFHKTDFEKRKSIIYKKAPEYGMFGVGDYSFSKYKIGISGFYKEPIFSLLYSEKPVMLDDTCYFISFNDKELALIILAILNHKLTQGFLKAISFVNSKRPYTKDILQRIDLKKLANYITPFEIKEYITKLDNNICMSEEQIISTLSKFFKDYTD